MSKLFQGITIAFFLFIIWIIYSANTGRNNIFFDFVKWLPFGDKVGHFCLFGILTMFFNIALKYKQIKIGRKFPLGTVIVSVFVLIEELSQAFLPNRTLDITDLIADALGILLFTYFSYLIVSKNSLGFEKRSIEFD